MFTSSILDAVLEKHVIFDNKPDLPTEFTNFRILDGSDAELSGKYLYIGRASDLYEATRNKWNKDALYTVIVTDGDEVMEIFTESPSFRIVRTDLKFNKVVNSLSEYADEYNRMYSLKRHLEGAPGVADPLIEGAARAMHADCFYVSSRFRIMSCCKSIECPEFQALEQGSYLEAKDLAMLKDEWTTYGDWTSRFSPIEHDNAVTAYVLIVMEKNSREKFNTDMLDLLKTCLRDFIGEMYSDRSVASGRFTRLIQDIITGGIITQEALNERLRSIDFVPSGMYRLIVIEPEKLMDAIHSDAFPSLGSVFPGSLPVQFDNKLLLLIPEKSGSVLQSHDEGAFSDILREYKLYACEGNLTTSLRSLRADYLKVSKCLGFARTFCEEKERRIFRAEEYAMYDVIDICCNALTDQYHGDTIHLCNRGAIILTSYDRVHGTDLSQILKSYLLNSMNTTKTAEEFGIHRNTLMYKLNKIRQITEEDLNDPHIAMRMLFSLFTIDYLSIYQNRSIIESEATSEAYL